MLMSMYEHILYEWVGIYIAVVEYLWYSWVGIYIFIITEQNFSDLIGRTECN